MDDFILVIPDDVGDGNIANHASGLQVDQGQCVALFVQELTAGLFFFTFPLDFPFWSALDALAIGADGASDSGPAGGLDGSEQKWL